MARPRLIKLTNKQFKEWLLDNFVDENGNKITCRDLMKSEKFKNEVFYNPSKTFGSIGTLSNWMGKLLTDEYPYKGEAVTEQLIFTHNLQKGVIKSISFDEWSRKYNKGHQSENTLINSEKIILNKVAEKLGSAFKCQEEAFQGNLDLFREFLVDYFGYDSYMEALNSLKGV